VRGFFAPAALIERMLARFARFDAQSPNSRRGRNGGGISAAASGLDRASAADPSEGAGVLL
jgi:hypothetical protein